MPLQETTRSGRANDTASSPATSSAPIEAAEVQQILGDLVVASNRLTRLAARVTGSTESPATWRTLSVLLAEGSMRLGELAAHSRVSQPTMTKIVRNLVDAEWIKRIADTDDARAWQIAIASKGERALADWRNQLASALLPMFADLSEHEVESLRDAVEIISSRVALSADAASAFRSQGR